MFLCAASLRFAMIADLATYRTIARQTARAVVCTGGHCTTCTNDAGLALLLCALRDASEVPNATRLVVAIDDPRALLRRSAALMRDGVTSIHARWRRLITIAPRDVFSCAVRHRLWQHRKTCRYACIIVECPKGDKRKRHSHTSRAAAPQLPRMRTAWPTPLLKRSVGVGRCARGQLITRDLGLLIGSEVPLPLHADTRGTISRRRMCATCIYLEKPAVHAVKTRRRWWFDRRCIDRRRWLAIR